MTQTTSVLRMPPLLPSQPFVDGVFDLTCDRLAFTQRFGWQMAPGEEVHPTLRVPSRPSPVCLVTKERR